MKFNSLIAEAILSGLVAGSIARAQDAGTEKDAKPAPAKAEKKHCKDKKHCDGKMMKKKKSCNGCEGDKKHEESTEHQE